VTSFRLKIVLWYTAVAMLTLIIFRFATVQVIRESLYAELDESLNGELVWIRAMLAANKARDLPDKEIREEILTRSRVSPRKEFIEIYDREGEEYFRSPNLAESDTLRLLVSVVDADSVLIQQFRDHQLRMIAWRASDFEIYIGYPLTDVNVAVDEITSSLLFLIPLSIVLFVIGGMFLGTRFVKPIKELRVYAEKLVDQPLDRDLPEVSSGAKDEVGLLVDQINTMVYRLRSSMRQVLSFSTLASHELRTPLAIIRNELEEVLRDGTSPEIIKEALASTYDEVLRLNRVVDDLLNLATMRAGTFRLEKKTVPIHSLLHDFAEDADLLCQSKGITLETSFQSPVDTDVDTQRFRTVLFNLLDNAVKYTPSGGEIRIRSLVHQQWMLLEFSDTGPGVKESELTHIFDPFRRAESEGKDPGGVGLGLALARYIVEAHGGSIRAEKTPSGTAFLITLPISRNTPETA